VPIRRGALTNQPPGAVTIPEAVDEESGRSERWWPSGSEKNGQVA